MRLLARRLQRNKAIVAIARELCGFIWELLRTQACYQAQSPDLKKMVRGEQTNSNNKEEETTKRKTPHTN